MPHSVLSTVSDHCTPRFGGKRRLPRPHSCAPPLLVTIKGGDGPPLDGTMLQTRSIITYAPASLFATFNPSSSRDLGAFLPLSPRLYPLLQALRVQDNTVPSHTPFAGRTAAGTRINRALLCCLLHHHLGRGNTQYLLVGIRPPGSGRRQLPFQI